MCHCVTLCVCGTVSPVLCVGLQVFQASSPLTGLPACPSWERDVRVKLEPSVDMKADPEAPCTPAPSPEFFFPAWPHEPTLQGPMTDDDVVSGMEGGITEADLFRFMQGEREAWLASPSADLTPLTWEF